jgi:uroporphyrinogen III methyltransferase/synthase
MNEFDWLVFSSANGVESILGRILGTGRDLRSLGSTKLAAIGPATADALRAFHLNADLAPNEYRAEALAESLVDAARGRAMAPRLLLVRASRGREVLAETLVAAGCAVEQVVAYQSVDVEAPDPDIASLLRQGHIDWITVTSSAIARSLARLFGHDLRRAKLASISPVTSATLRELGYEAAAEAREYTMAGLVEALVERAE